MVAMADSSATATSSITSDAIWKKFTNGPCLHGSGSPSTNTISYSIGAAFSSIFDTEQYLFFDSATASSTALRLRLAAHRVRQLDAA